MELIFICQNLMRTILHVQQGLSRLVLVADPVTQAIGGSEFEDGLMSVSPGDVLPVSVRTNLLEVPKQPNKLA